MLRFCINQILLAILKFDKKSILENNSKKKSNISFETHIVHVEIFMLMISKDNKVVDSTPNLVEWVSQNAA